MSLSSLTLLLLASASPLGATAPDRDDPPRVETAAEDPAVDDSQDVVVTARRREERVQDVPIALSVLSGEDLAESGAFNVNRLQQSQPTLQFYSSNPRNSAINIRGLGAPFGLTNDGIEQGVGFYVDGVYIGRIGASTFDFVDVERVEVLRGPQGTLYGKNTTAGAINITTRAPSFEPESRVEVSIGNYEFLQAKASVSAPLADNVAFRLSTSGTTREGTVLNVRTGVDQHRLRNLGVRGQLLWRATPDLDFTLSGDFNRQNPLCCVQYYAREGATQRPLNRQYAALAAAFGYAPPSKDPFDRVTDLDADSNSRQEIGGASLVGNWNIGGATITSVTAWRYWDWLPANDRDFIGLPITTVSQNPSQQKQFSQELRIASNGSGPLQYTLGAFYFHQTIDTQGSQVQGPAASRWLLNPGASVPPGSSGCATATTAACNPAVLNGLTSTNTISFDNTSFAVFGKLNWEVAEGLHIQPGLRVNYDKKRGSYVSVVTTGAGSTTLTSDQRGVLAPQAYEPAFSDWNVSGDFTVSYDFSPDIHAYATYARSFKSGGINLSGLPLDAANNPILAVATVKPEKVNHYEIGLKTQFADRKVTLNLAAYWTEVNDYQATVTNGQLGVIRGYLANAEKVRVRGFELDSSFRPSARFNVYGNAAFTDATYASFKDAPCPPELAGGTTATAAQTPGAPGTPGGLSPAFCDISGQWLPGISKWSLAWGGEGNVPVGNGQVYLGYDGSYRSKFSSNPSRSRYMDIDGYSLSNFRLGYREGDFNIFGWVRNAFDQHYFELLSAQSGSTGLIVGQPADPRTYGLTVSSSF
ncbi:iron complex outermembrane receptor protein [Sphingomonas naasensis]|uniref:TonB-dependent receptor n=1 Tax=Sphingomonas naasensis TaxID=1344951 RepID=A0A4S1WM07_9SPHN|nr:TonB-dependent receptor [Sphingomonas naasensis]NIJ20168.1 iron complex outermembrane receptor protein [Sphingomonas naasensis]TGX44318.1 TonB-dependent receptor [Sphingomonas naasensis]